MKITAIYKKYFIPPILEQHMLRVAALGQILAEQWNGEKIAKNEIVTALLFHDIAKPITFDLAKQAQYGMPENEIARLAKYQTRVKAEYGTDEHKIAVAIAEVLHLQSESIRILQNFEWSSIPDIIANQDWNTMIAIYCDLRIGPRGIMSLKKRLDDIKARTGHPEYDEDLKNGQKLESELKANLKVDVNSITDQQLAELMKNFEIEIDSPR